MVRPPSRRAVLGPSGRGADRDGHKGATFFCNAHDITKVKGGVKGGQLGRMNGSNPLKCVWVPIRWKAPRSYGSRRSSRSDCGCGSWPNRSIGRGLQLLPGAMVRRPGCSRVATRGGEPALAGPSLGRSRPTQQSGQKLLCSGGSLPPSGTMSTIDGETINRPRSI